MIVHRGYSKVQRQSSRIGWFLVTVSLHCCFEATNGFQVILPTRVSKRRFLESRLLIADEENGTSIVSHETSPSSSTTTEEEAIVLPGFQQWMIDSLKKSYDKALSIPCPFFRRRAADAMDAIDMILRFLLIRHKSVVSMLEPPGWRCKGDTTPKTYGITITELAETIRKDWKLENDKGYYITGRLSTSIYRDDCFFEGPDPDMPVRGLRKYLNAASQLF